MAELTRKERRGFAMSKQGNRWMPERDDEIQATAKTVVLRHSGKQQRIHEVGDDLKR